MTGKKKAELKLTVSRVERAIGYKSSTWPGNCYGVASKLVEAGLVPGGAAVYGHWLGEISSKSFFALRRGHGFCQHGWVSAPGGVVVDPTRWVFEAVKPYVYVGRESDAAEDWPYDEGGNKLRAALLRPPPKTKKNDVRVPTQAVGFQLSSDAIGYLQVLFKSLDAGLFGPTRDQTFWLANLPLEAFGPYADELYRWLDFHGHQVWIPLDNWRAVLRARRRA